MNGFTNYSGLLTYNGVEFTFVFDGKQLKLIPDEENKLNVSLWFKKEIAPGVFVAGDPLFIEDVLSGFTNETGHKIFFVPSLSDVGYINSTLLIDIDYYVVNKYDDEKIDRITFKGPEISKIFPNSIGLNKIDWKGNGVVDISTKSFDETTTEKESFKIGSRKLNIYFGISLSSSKKDTDKPLNISSTLFVEFSPTNDFKFILKVVDYVKNFLQFMCYRKNISFTEIELASPYEGKLHHTFALLYFTKEEIYEQRPLDKNVCILYDDIKGSIANLLNDIISDRIYLKHIPESYFRRFNINAGDFVIITAGFEWEFRRYFPDGPVKRKQTIDAENYVNKTLDDLITKNGGKAKDIFKRLKNNVDFINLQQKIITFGKEFSEIFDDVASKIYKLHGEELIYPKVGERLSKQRNNFAHGNIDQEFIGDSLLDLVLLEYIIYFLQLKSIGVNDKSIINALKSIF